jgi:hypothetical protein
VVDHETARGTYTAAVSSIAEQMGREAREEARRLPLAERLRRALEMGELALDAYRKARQLDRTTAIQQLEARRQRGRRPCRFLENALE